MEQEDKKGRGRPRKDAGEHSRIKSINVTASQKAALTAYSKATGKTISALVDEWIREAINESSNV